MPARACARRARIGEREGEEGGGVALVRADVVALDGSEVDGDDRRAFVDQPRDGVRELDLAVGCGGGRPERVVDRRLEDVAVGDGERARRLAGIGLLDDRGDARDVAVGLSGDDPVAPGLRARYLAHRDGAHGIVLVQRLREPLDHGRPLVRPEDRVPERDRERLVAGRPLGAQQRIAEPARRRLARVGELDAHLLEDEAVEQRAVLTLLEHRRQVRIAIEVILDRPLAAPGHEHDPLDPRRRQLLDDVLHDRLAADRQHLLGLALGRRQQPRPKTGDRDDGGRHEGHRSAMLRAGLSRAHGFHGAFTTGVPRRMRATGSAAISSAPRRDSSVGRAHD